jgi:hypothetical protein
VRNGSALDEGSWGGASGEMTYVLLCEVSALESGLLQWGMRTPACLQQFHRGRQPMQVHMDFSTDSSTTCEREHVWTPHLVSHLNNYSLETLRTQVLDNLPHDRVVWAQEQGTWLQTHIDAATMSEARVLDFRRVCLMHSLAHASTAVSSCIAADGSM